jgi:DNA-binding MurR/RpiR family transcriptional regulator
MTLSFVRRLQGALNDLPEAERRLADFALDFPGNLASYSASELAKLAGVSNATVTRLVQRLGYDDFNSVRRSVREERETGSPLMLDARSADEADALKPHLTFSQANLEQTFSRIAEADIEAIVAAMAQARNVWVAGFRSSHAFAAYFRWQILQFLPNTRLLPGPGETLGEHLASFDGQDVLVAFGLRRRMTQLQTIVDHAGRAGAKVAYIGDHLIGEVRNATWLLRCDVRAPGPFDNHVAVTALCDLLMTRLFQVMGKTARQHLAVVEAAHESAEEL